jgi:hypothetical protein
MVDKADNGQSAEQREDPLGQNLVLQKMAKSLVPHEATDHLFSATYHEHEGEYTPNNWKQWLAQAQFEQHKEGGTNQ